MDLAYPFCGFIVGALVGFTGMGGGSVMTALLILVFGLHPASAVGTDLMFAAVTKSAGAHVHARRGNVAWRVVGLLALGSVPGTLATVYVLSQLPVRSPAVERWLTIAIGLALIVAAIGLLVGPWLSRFITVAGSQGSVSERPAPAWVTVLLGVGLGVVVSLTSVGAGAIGIVLLRLIYRQMPMVALVGSDIAHAVPLTLLAGTGHWLIGDVDWRLLVQLLAGSLPGIVLASIVAHRVPERVLRPALAVVLIAISVPLTLK